MIWKYCIGPLPRTHTHTHAHTHTPTVTQNVNLLLRPLLPITPKMVYTCSNAITIDLIAGIVIHTVLLTPSLLMCWYCRPILIYLDQDPDTVRYTSEHIQ